MHARASLLVNVLVLAAIAAAPSRAVAQPATVQAQALFDEGRRLMAAGKLAEACVAFEASQKLDPVVSTLLNLAACRERNRQLATAWGLFVDANRMARNAGDDRLAKVATTHARKLEPRLSRLTIAVPPDHRIPGLVVQRGDDPVDPVVWNHALPIDGGTYTITARAPGRQPWSTTTTIKAQRDAQTIQIPKLAGLGSGAPPAVAGRSGGPAAAPAGRPAPVTPAAAPAGRPAPVPTPPAVATRGLPEAVPTRGETPPSAPVAARSSHAEHPAITPSMAPRGDEPPPTATAASGSSSSWKVPPSRWIPIALGAGAVALSGAALGFELSGNRLYDRAKAAPTIVEGERLRDSANTRRYLAEGLGVAALGCAGAAVYLYVRGRGESRPAVTAVAPIALPDLAGFAVAGRW